MTRWIGALLLAFAAVWAQTTDKPPVPPPVAEPTKADAASPVKPDPTALQREAVQKQARSVGARLIPLSPGPQLFATPADCDPLADAEVKPLIDAAAKREQLDAKVIRAVIEQESALRPCAVSPKGAQGLMQLMPDTAAQLSVGDAFDPGQNIDAGARYLKQLLDRYKGDLKRALAAYNAGPAEVDKAGGIPKISETETYVDRIMKKVSAADTSANAQSNK